jgi:predicted glycoside hydrolase/deacetylase ChbG (UPF0249 family)
MKKRIVLCADDYGQAPAISQGILHLIEQNRLSATSCMVNRPAAQAALAWLRPFANQIDVGLHFNLTEGRPLSAAFIQAYGTAFPSLYTLLAKAWLRQLDLKIIEEECHAQLDYFEQNLNFLPHFIDGHQHVHQFPIIRNALMNVYEKRLRPAHTYVRFVNQKVEKPYWFKKSVIDASGARALGHLLKKRGIPHNASFSGVYDFSNATSYSILFASFLAEITDKGLMMCHPGLAASETEDGIAAARYAEYQYLASPQFILDCEQAGVSVQRFCSINSA